MRRWLAMENGPIGTPQHARQRQRSKVGEERRGGTRRDSIEARGGRRRFRRFALISMQTTAAVSHRLASLLLVRATDAALLQDTPAAHTVNVKWPIFNGLSLSRWTTERFRFTERGRLADLRMGESSRPHVNAPCHQRGVGNGLSKATMKILTAIACPIVMVITKSLASPVAL